MVRGTRTNTGRSRRRRRSGHNGPAWRERDRRGAHEVHGRGHGRVGRRRGRRGVGCSRPRRHGLVQVVHVHQQQQVAKAQEAAAPAAVLLKRTALDSGRSEPAAGFMPEGGVVFVKLSSRGLCGLF